MVTQAVQKAQEKMNNDTKPAPIMWSASSWESYKRCPHSLFIKSQKWSNPQTKSDKRIATMAVPGLVIDRLFELWFHKGEFDNRKWLDNNFSMIWNMILSQRRPKWANNIEKEALLKQTRESIEILYGLLHKHRLLNPNYMKIQTSFHELITETSPTISIAGAIDLCTMRDEKTLILIDLKNFQSWRRRSTDQLHIYAMAIEKMFGRTPDEAGYLCFNPKFPGYRIRQLRLCDRRKLLSRLQIATVLRAAGELKPKYNGYSCPRFCHVRFACKTFLRACGARPNDKQTTLAQ